LKALIIKNFDQNFKTYQIQDFFKYVLIQKNTIPIFFTTHNNNTSASRIIPKGIIEYIFEPPLNTHLCEIAQNLMKKKIDNKFHIEKIVKESKGDIRFIENNII
jgi:hypothetical protein